MAKKLAYLISKRNFEAAHFSYAIVKPGGSDVLLDLVLQTSPDCDMAKISRKEGWGIWQNRLSLSFTIAPPHKDTPYYYNRPSSQLVGNYGNRVVAQPAKYWRLTTFITAADNYELLI